MDSARTDRRGTSRLLAVCAVLFGLFLMHGTPATAAEGCHGAMPTAAHPPMTAIAGSPMTAVADSAMTVAADARMTVAADVPMTGGRHAAMTSSAWAPPVVHASGFLVRSADASGMPGTLCVSTPAHDRTPLPAPGLLALAGVAALVLWGLARLRAAAGGAGWRGPPAGGRDLLLQVCVART
ncbi:hypothetical protein [Streptomyces sp. NPDC050534]|uniref:hypothetical protein n=1 Tax=Streptomyces sp. NPDC050534 TaxID=3365625 RepID=UPI0037913C48